MHTQESQFGGQVPEKLRMGKQVTSMAYVYFQIRTMRFLDICNTGFQFIIIRLDGCIVCRSHTFLDTVQQAYKDDKHTHGAYIQAEPVS